MITYDEAIKIIRDTGAKHLLSKEEVALQDIAGRVCAEEICAPLTIQPFDNSAMDGFALKAEEIANAANDNPVFLELGEMIAAGDRPSSQSLANGQCMEIMTGAPVPPGCDTVVPVELIQREGQKIIFNAPASQGDHIRYAGEDFKAGDPVIAQGDALDSRHIMVLATLGVDKVAVYKKPKIGFVTTGREIIDDLAGSLEPGQIYNSNGPFLKSTLSALGTDTVGYGTIADEEDAFALSVSQMKKDGVDIIISTGAVSAGVFDFVRKVLEDMGAEILFHKTKIRPGKPVLFAQFPNGGPLFFGLPGNPVATVAGARFFVYPCLREMTGREPEAPVKAILADDYKKGKSDFRFFLKAKLGSSSEGKTEVEILSGQQSFMVHPLLDTNSWVVAAEGQTDWKAGDVIDVYPFAPECF